MSVKCLLCGKEFGAITHTHLESTHGVTMDDYREMFSDAALRVVGVGTLQRMREAS